MSCMQTPRENSAGAANENSNNFDAKSDLDIIHEA